MPPTSDFQPWATTGGAPNVEDLADYDASDDLADGFQVGEVPASNRFNRAVRQATWWGAVISNWIVDILSVDVLDNGDLAGAITQFEDALATYVAGGGFLIRANNLSDLTNVSAARSNLGLGTAAVLAASNASDSTLASVTGAITIGHVALFADTSGSVEDGGALGTAAFQSTTAFLQVANNLGDLASTSVARANLGLGTAALKAASNNSDSTLASVTGSFTVGNVAVFADTSGSIKDSGIPQLLEARATYTVSGGGITGALNVESVTKNSTGNYTVNYGTALLSANYQALVQVIRAVGANITSSVSAKGTASVTVFFNEVETGSPLDPDGFDIVVFGQ
jgi:hypothetical protein